MSTQIQSLPPLGPQDLARVSTLYAHSASKIGGTDHQQEVDRFLAWVLGIQREAAKPLERMVQELEAENARLQQELAEAEATTTRPSGHQVEMTFEGESAPSTGWVCNAESQSFCRAKWECDCETMRDFSVVDGKPAHGAWDDDYDDEVTHWGTFTDGCSLGAWFDECHALYGEIVVDVNEDWDHDHYDLVITGAHMKETAL